METILQKYIWVSPIFFTEFREKILYFKKTGQTWHLLCKRPSWYYITSKTQRAEVIFNSCFSDLSDSWNLLNSVNHWLSLYFITMTRKSITRRVPRSITLSGLGSTLNESIFTWETCCGSLSVVAFVLCRLVVTYSHIWPIDDSWTGCDV